HPGRLDPYAGLLLGLTYGALCRRLPEFHLAHRDGPLPGVAPTLEQQPALLVHGEDAERGDEAVRGRGGRVVPEVGAAHQVPPVTRRASGRCRRSGALGRLSPPPGWPTRVGGVRLPGRTRGFRRARLGPCRRGSLCGL